MRLRLTVPTVSLTFNMLTSSPTPQIIMGIDASLRATGIGIVEALGSKLKPHYYGVLRNPPSRPLSACLAHLQTEIAQLITVYQPSAVALEAIFYAKNVKTMLILSHARGALIAQCAQAALPIYEYEPRRIKQAVVGYGSAQKVQVQTMVKNLLALAEEPPHDAADALAVAITHLHNCTNVRVLAPEPI